MKAKDIARIKKFLAGPGGKRLEEGLGGGSGLGQPVQNAKSRRAVAKLSMRTARKFNRGEFDYRAFEKEYAEILAKDEADLSGKFRKARAGAVKGSGAKQKLLSAEASAKLAGLNSLVALEPAAASPRYELLKAPFEIVSNVKLDAAESIPVKSFAKFRVAADRRNVDATVQFNYLWQNLSDKVAVINVNGYMIFHGHAFIGSGGGVCPGSRSASYDVAGELSLLQFWTDPPTTAFQQPDHAASISSLSVTTGGFDEVGAIDARDIFRGCDLGHTQLVVPPTGVLVIRLSARVSCRCGSDSGNVDVDFASGAFNVGSPAVLVTIVS